MGGWGEAGFAGCCCVLDGGFVCGLVSALLDCLGYTGHWCDYRRLIFWVENCVWIESSFALCYMWLLLGCTGIMAAYQGLILKKNKINIPRKSSCRTVNLPSSTSSPSSNSFLVSSGSFRAVATTGAFVVCRTLLASAKPMPLEAGDMRDHGGILKL